MTAWIEGRTFKHFGRDVVCVRRWFDGALELVKVATPLAVGAEDCRGKTVHTALAAAAGTIVTETLGGVYRADMCRHEQALDGSPRRVLANAGPFCGRLCCAFCGLALDATPAETAFAGEACERRAADPGSHYLTRHAL